MKSITEEEFRKEYKIEKSDYARSRWPYYKACIELAQEEGFNNVLELGPWRLPLFHGSDTMDNKLWAGVDLTYFHDATKVPWPIENKKYDLFIALQVWEHLEGKQIEAFEEVMRISKRAILSFPYNWRTRTSDPVHYGIGERCIALWTHNVTPKKISRIGSRIIYVFRFAR